MRETLIIPKSSLVSSRVEVVLSFSVYILSLHYMSGALDLVVKKDYKTLAFFFKSFEVVEGTYYKSKKCYKWKNLGCYRS